MNLEENGRQREASDKELPFGFLVVPGSHIILILKAIPKMIGIFETDHTLYLFNTQRGTLQ